MSREDQSGDPYYSRTVASLSMLETGGTRLEDNVSK